jgi:hypothetical protein
LLWKMSKSFLFLNTNKKYTLIAITIHKRKPSVLFDN